MQQLTGQMYKAAEKLPSIGAPKGWVIMPDGPYLFVVRRVLRSQLSEEDRAQLIEVDVRTGGRAS